MELNNIYNGNSIDLIKNINTEEIHLILSDIPYGIGFADWDILHQNTNTALGGASPAQKKNRKYFQNTRKTP